MADLDTVLLQYCANDPGDCQNIQDALNNGTIFDYCTQHGDNPYCLRLVAQGCNASLLSPDNWANCLVNQGSQGSSNAALSQCQAQADLHTYDLDQLVAQLAASWNPNPFFTSQIMIEMVGRWNERSVVARQAITNAQANAGISDKFLLKDRLDSLDTFDRQAQTYLQAAQDVGADGLVQADKLKDWATGGLRAASDALHASEVVTCVHDQDWSPLVALGQFFWSVGGVAKEVADAAYKAGKKIIKASEWLLGALGWVVTHGWTVFGIGLVIAGGVLAIKHREKLKGAFGRFHTSKPALSGKR